MIRIIIKLIPPQIKDYFIKNVRVSIVKSINQFLSEKPKVDLSEIHISNCKLVTDRARLLELLPKNGIVAEIGVDQGDFSSKILEINQPHSLHLVDNWGSSRYGIVKEEKVKNKFKGIDPVNIHKGLSTDVVDNFNDAYFDWIYIDTVHDYLTTKQELSLYNHKVKPAGIIAGHDYTSGNWAKILPYGVVAAVHEFCVNEHWELIYLTVEQTNFPSFAIRRIRNK